VIRRAVLLLCAFALVACERAAAPRPKRAAAKKPAAKSAPAPPNLLDIARGAAVVSRTGENNLEFSAVHAIDGLEGTSWSSTPGGAHQVLVYSLAAPARIERLGVAVGKHLDHLPVALRFELSSDGITWREAITLRPTKSVTESITPTVAQYLRLTTAETKRYYATAISFTALGRFETAAVPRSFDGCWSLNFAPAHFVQRGARITGALGDERKTFVDGGTDGVVARFMWMRGPMWGHAIATVTPDGRAFSALTFHEIPRAEHVGEAWIGERTAECTEVGARTPNAFLQRTRHWSMFGLVFDAREMLDLARSKETLDEAAALIARSPSQKFRVVAHDFRSRDASENLRRSEARAAAVGKALIARGVDGSRVEVGATGSTRQDAEIASEGQRILWTRVDLELLP
jgi:hypothetical protein